MAINVKRINSDKKKCKVVTATVSDLSELLEGKAKYNGNDDECRSFVRDALKDDSWSNDPGPGNSKDRVRGDFKYARDIMSQYTPLELIGNIESLQAQIAWGRETGTFVDVDAYFAGENEFHGEIIMPTIDDGERTMRIAIGIGGNCNISAEELVKRAARVLRVASAYDEAGYNVELYAFFAAQYKYKRNDHHVVAIIDCSKATVGQSIAMLSSAKIFRSLVFSLVCWEDSVSMCGYPVNHTQSPEDMGVINKHIREVLGGNCKVIHAGASDDQIKADVA